MKNKNMREIILHMSINKNILLLSTLLIVAFNTYAGIERTSSPKLEGVSFTNGAILDVVDDKYTVMDNNTNWPTLFYNNRISNQVVFSYTNPSNTFYATAFSATLIVNITTEEWDESTEEFVEQPVVQKTLTVNYEPGSSYSDISVYEFAGGNKLSVNVVNLSSSNPNVNFTLETQIEVERFYTFDYAYVPSISHHSHQLLVRGELEIFWNVIPGAEEYDLEWAYVNNYEDINTQIAPQNINIDPRIFQFNSTRVTTTNNKFMMPYLYGKGYILYRVRGKGKTSLNDYTDLIDGRWSSFPDNFTSVAAFPSKFPNQLLSGSLNTNENFIAHEDEFNWQVSSSYAEEGKSKSVISYFDGGLRNRQTVTKLKTIDQVVVGESIYDHQGRPAIQVLPVPVNSTRIDFQPNFNQFYDGSVAVPYSRDQFDFDEVGGMCPTPLPEPMYSNTSGASNYYSPSNPDKNGHQAYVPDADEYPFTQVEYTPDNTGRIRAQSGVGPTFQLSQDHETKYYYGTPEQEELNRLFGSEVGLAAHYKKNMVRDANGQMSVSYLDPQGRVVATGLTGLSPLNLHHLDSAPWESLNVDLLNKQVATDNSGANNILDLNKRSLTVNRTFLIGADQERDFNYKMIGNKYRAICTDDVLSSICYDCVLDLTVSLTDECNEEHFNGSAAAPSAPLVIGQHILDSINAFKTRSLLDTILGTSPLSFPNDCNLDETISDSLFFDDIELKTGNYQLTKKLTINEDALAYYTNLHIANDTTCLLDFDVFLDTALAQIDMSGCNMSCSECVTSLGTYPQYNVSETPDCDPCFTEEHYEELLVKCNESCDSRSYKCDALFSTMKSDMNPYGQYGLVREGAGITDGAIDSTFIPEPSDPPVNNFDPSVFPLSVFNSANRLPQKVAYSEIYPPIYIGVMQGYNWRPNWRFPYDPNIGSNNYTYLDDQGNTALVRLEKIATNVYEPAIIDTLYIEDYSDGSGIGIRPQYLASVEDFVTLWEPQWADALVTYHPEYGYYLYCQDLTESNDFDDLWTELRTRDDADSVYGIVSEVSNFMNPVASGKDPYFTPGGNPHHFDADERRAMLYAMENFTEDYSIWELAYIMVNCPNANNSMSCPTCIYPDSLTTDDEWNVFKGLYRGLKQKFMTRAYTIYAIENGFYNGCIGDEAFRVHKDNFISYRYTRPGTVGFGNFWNTFNNASYFPMVTSQYFNHEQPCNWFNDTLYADKQQRHGDVKSLLELPSTEENICYANESLMYPGDSDFMQEYDVVDCNAKAQMIVDETGNMTRMAMYDQCGKCPNAQHLEVFLGGMVRQDTLTATGVALSCYGTTGSNIMEFTEQFAATLDLDNISNVEWNIVSTDNNTLVATFNDATIPTDNCEISLKFPEENTLYDFSDITNICCLKDISNPTMFAYVANKNFEFKATVKLKPGDPRYHVLRPDRTREFEMEGVSCIKVGDCQFDPICHTSKQAKYFQNVLNGLVILKDSLRNEDVALTDTIMTSVFSKLQNEVDALIDYGNIDANEDWRWTGEVNPIGLSGFRGTIAAADQTGSLTFDLYHPTPNINFDNIIRFSNIRPYDGLVDTNFSITAMVLDKSVPSAVPTYVKLYGKSSALSMGECSVTLPTLYVLGARGSGTSINSNASGNLIPNGDFENGNDAFYSDDYQYETPGNKSTEGEYSIVVSGYDANSCCWEGEDHTSGHTNLMSVAGRTNATTSVWRHATFNVDTGTTYLFSAWLSTLDASCEYPAVIRFKINGEEVGYDFTAPTTTHRWIRNAVLWQSGPNNTVELEILTKNTRSESTGFGLDDIFFGTIQGSSSIMCDIYTPPTIELDSDPCLTQMLHLAQMNAQKNHASYIADIRQEFQENYIKKCLDVYEKFEMGYIDTEGQITLYYYDQAGNLVRTVPPAGVRKVTDTDDLLQVKEDQANKTHTFLTDHTLATTYKYNSLNQLVAQAMPDHVNIEIFTPTPAMNGIEVNHTVTNTTFSDELHGQAFALDEYGVGHVYRTTDGGEMWTPAMDYGIRDLNDVQFTSVDIAYIVGDEGIVIKTINQGASWDIITPPTWISLFRLTFFDDLNGTVYSEEGDAWTTIDGGANWSDAEPSLNVRMGADLINDVAMVDLDTSIVITSGGEILKTIDKGQTWTNMLIRNAGLNKVSSIDGTRFIVGDGGLVLRSIDDGESWEELPNTIYSDLVDVHFITPQKGWIIVDSLDRAAGEAGVFRKLYETSDGGVTWEIPTLFIGVDNIADMHFSSAFDGFVVTTTGTLYKYAGNSWSLWPTSIPSTGITCITMKNSLGYIGGDNGLFYKTIDHGVNWTTETFELEGVASTANIGDLSFATGGGLLVHTDNISTIYTEASQPNHKYIIYYASPTEQDASPINFSQRFESSAGHRVFIASTTTDNVIYGLAFGDAGTIDLVTSTIDVSNHQLSTPVVNDLGLKVHLPGRNMKSIDIDSDGNGTMVGNVGEILTTTNGGIDWVDRSYMTRLGKDLNAIGFTRPKLYQKAGVIVCDNGRVLRNYYAKVGNTYTPRYWLVQPKRAHEDLMDISFPIYEDESDPNMQEAVIVGKNGYMAYVAGSNVTSFGYYGDEYTVVPTGITNTLNSVVLSYHSGDYHAQAVGDDGAIVHLKFADDDAVNYQVEVNNSLPASSDQLRAVAHSPDFSSQPSRHIAVGENGRVVGRPSGNVNNWSIISAFKTPVMHDAHMYSTTDGVAVGDDGSILVTNDGGVSWQTVSNSSSSDPLEDLNAIHVYPGGTSYFSSQLIAVGDNGTIRTKANGSTTWVTSLSSPGTENFNDVYVEGQLGLIVGDNGSAYKSTDGGATWPFPDLFTDAGSTNINAVYIVDASFAYAVGENGLARGITDNGDVWATQISGTSEDLNDVYFISKAVGYAVGDAATFIKTIDGGLDWGVKDLETASSVDFNNIESIDNSTYYVGGTEGSVTHVYDQNDNISSRFWYDQLGRLVVSQNSMQFHKTPNRRTYSYTLYDYKGRITEVGEIYAPNTPIEALYTNSVLNDALFQAWINDPANAKTEVTHTYYDFAVFGSVIPLAQENLRNRVSSVTYEDERDGNNATYQHATHYTYDIHGNVKTLLQDNPSLD